MNCIVSENHGIAALELFANFEDKKKFNFGKVISDQILHTHLSECFKRCFGYCLVYYYLYFLGLGLINNTNKKQKYFVFLGSEI